MPFSLKDADPVDSLNLHSLRELDPLLQNQEEPTWDTQLSDEDERNFQAWAQRYNRLNDTQDYDLRGWWQKYQGADPGQQHMTDEFKKPNHPTFSTESIYHGVGGNQGGTWTQMPDGSFQFTPGATNMQQWPRDQLMNYFQRVEPGNVLNYPGMQE